MEGLDPVARELERIQRRASQAFTAASISAAVTRRPAGVEVSRSNFARRLDQGGIAARGDVVDDGARGGLDIGRNLALGGEEGRESLVEIGAAAVETNGHWLASLAGGAVWLTGPLLNGAAGKRRQPLAVAPWKSPCTAGPEPVGRIQATSPLRLDRPVAGPEIVRPEVGQLAFQTFDVEPERAALG